MDLDIQPLETKLDIQPLDIQPMEAPKSGASSIPGAEEYDKRAKPTEDKPDLKNDLLGEKKGLAGVQGVGEAAKSIGSGLLSSFAAPAVGFAKSLYGDQTGPEAAQEFASKYTYEPKSEEGQQIIQNIQPALDTMVAIGGMHLGTPLPMRVPKSARLAETAASDTKATALEAHLDRTEPLDVQPLQEQQGPVLPNRTQVGNARTTMESPVTTAANPIERMTAQLAPGADRELTPGAEMGGRDETPAMGQMAEQLVNKSTPESRAADDLIAHRQDEMTDEVKRKVALQQEAAFRQQAEQGTQFVQEAQERVQAEQQRLAELQKQAATNEAARQQLAEQQAAVERAQDAQKQLEARQQQLEFEVKQRQTLDFGAAERARQEAAPIPPDLPRGPTPPPRPYDEIGPAPMPQPEPAPRPPGMNSPSEIADAAISHRQDLMQDEMNRNAAMERNAAFSRKYLSKQSGHVTPDFLANLATLGLKMVVDGSLHKVVDSAGKVVGKLESNMSGEQNRRLKAMGEKIPANVDMVKVADEVKGKGVGAALYQSWANEHEGNIAPHGNTTQAAWDLWKRNFPDQVDKYVTDAATRIQTGTPLRQILDQVKDPVIANRIRTEAYEPGTPVYRSLAERNSKEAGFIKLPFGKSKGIQDALKDGPLAERLGAKFGIDRRTPAEVVSNLKNIPDVAQNAVQKLFNGLTKGGTYLSERLNHPAFKYVVDQFKEAENRTKAQLGTFLHDMYVPAIRKLSDTEMSEAWKAIDTMDKRNRRLSDGELEHLGYSAGARQAIQTHFQVMDEMVPKINQALKDAGMSTIDPRAAYAASKLNGTFRKVLMNDKGEVVAALGAKTTRDLARQVEGAKTHLEGNVTEGPMITMPMRKVGDLSDIMSFLANNDPQMHEWMKNSQDALAPKPVMSHFMEKKGVMGMQGRKPWESDYTNAKEGFNAQVAYVKRMMEFAEKAKAEKNVREVLNSKEWDGDNVKQLAQRYSDTELGRNPSKFKAAIDGVAHAFDTEFGGNIRFVKDTADNARKLFNFKMLTLNVGFLIQHALTPMRNMPELASMLGGYGATERSSMISLGKVLPQMASGEYSPILRQAMDYAKQNGIYGDLFSHEQGIRGFGSGEGFGEKMRNSIDAIESGLSKPSSFVENNARKAFFLSMTDLLHRNGITPEQGLFDIASNMTDKGMNKYSQSESPQWVKNMGPMSKMPYNLGSFHFNELSRFAALAREVGTNGNVKPLLTSVAMQVAYAGLFGLMGYQAANKLVTELSQAMGKPTTLTKIILDNADKLQLGPVNLAYGGLSSLMHVDMSRRMGEANVLGGDNSIADSVWPGLSAGMKMASSAYDLGKGLVQNPTGSANAYKAKQLAMDVVPGLQMFERQLFPEQQTKDGKSIGWDRNKAEAGVERNNWDKGWKQVGMTGIAEQTKKANLYENKKVDAMYQAKQEEAITNLAEGYKESGKMDPLYIKQFQKYQGDPNTIEQRITEIAVKANIPADIRDKIKAATQGEGQPQRMMRRFH